MKGLEIEAVYQDNTLRLPRPLPLAEGQRRIITIHPPGGIAEQGYGLLQSTLNTEQLERGALEPECGIMEGP